MEGSRSSNDQNNYKDNGLMDSIAALRSVLMLDTPTRVALVGHRSNEDYQPVKPQRQLCFSPDSTTQAKTPESKKKTPIENSPLGKPPMSGKRPSFVLKTPSTSKLPPSPEMQRMTTVLQKKAQTLETSQAELEKRLKEEIDRRMMVEATYEKLSEFQTQQTSQLERVTASRDKFRDESMEWKKTIEIERIKFTKGISTMKNNTKTLIESQRLKDKDASQAEIEILQKQLRKKEERYHESESLVKSLTKEVEKLNADLKTRQQTHESTMLTTINAHTKEIASLQVVIGRIESDGKKHMNKEKENTDQINAQLQKAQMDMIKMKQDHSSEKERMESEKVDFQNSLKELTKLGNGSEQKLQEATDEIIRLHQKVEEARVDRKTSEEKLQDQLSSCNVLQLEKQELERQLCDAKDNSLNLAGTKNLHFTIHELESKKTALERQLLDSENSCKGVQKAWQETQMELEGLKQNLEEAERIEVQNEDLQRELKETKEMVTLLEEKLNVFELSNSNHLIEVATLREKIRGLEGELEELKEIYNNTAECQEIDEIENKRDNEKDEESSSPRKRLKTRIDDQHEGFEEDEIVL